jgi:allantoin racemase
LIQNPNSDEGMTAEIRDAARRYADGRFTVECLSTPGAPRFIETYADMAQAGPGLVRTMQQNQEKYDGFVLACHYDPHLDVLKEITAKPVVGIGEASLRFAAMLGHSFSLITTDEHSIPIHRNLIRKYELQDALASVRAPSVDMGSFAENERYLKLARKTVASDGAEVIVLGCAGLSRLAKELQEATGVPVLDGVICALFLAEGLAHYGVGISKVRRFNPDTSGKAPDHG